MSLNHKHAEKPMVCTISTTLGILLAMIDFAASLPRQHNLDQHNNPEMILLIFGFCFACWVGTPLVMLGQMKIFWASPKLTLILLVIGCVSLLSQFYEVFIAPKHSTAALGLLAVPFILLLIYGVIALVLKLDQKWQ
jgi:predicted membrane protein